MHIFPSLLLAVMLTAEGVAQNSTPAALAAEPAAQAPSSGARMPDPEKVHDPSTVITMDGVRRFFATGTGLLLFRESPTGSWVREGRVFGEGKFPAWHAEAVPGNRGHLWAPDVIQIGDRILVYYSVSTFGKNASAIGLATGKSLDPSSNQWRWEDHGPVVLSAAKDRYNAIDPAIFRDPADGSLWMTFGSFWDGIHLIELDPTTGMQRNPEQRPVRLAWKPEIEAPFLHRQGDYYYLFGNWGKCCRGVKSTYEIRVGRSRSVKGPYLDRSGKDLVEGGGTLILESEGRWIGPGHPSIHEHQGRELLAHHYYDGELEGRSRFRLLPLSWDSEAWPVIGESAPR
jgi:arabinan endo-1,5-alpha-L-arabinosidase